MDDFIKHRNIITIIPGEVISGYCSENEFENKADKFFHDLSKQENDFRLMKYPFDGEYLLNIDNWQSIVDQIPEFIVSIITVGIPKILALQNFNKYTDTKEIVLSKDTLVESSKIILNSWNLCALWYDTNHKDEELKKNLIEKFLLLKIHENFTDIFGCLQLIRNEILFRLDITRKVKVKDIDFILPIERKKKKLLLGLTANFTRVLYNLNMPLQDKLVKYSQKRYLNASNIAIYEGIPEYTHERLKPSEKTIFPSDSLKKEIEHLKSSNDPALFISEIGTGKEYFARYISRQNAPFIIYDCPIYSNSTTKLETFFNSLNKENPIKHPGYLKLAEGGTIFFREIDEMPRDAQASLFRIWAENKYDNIRFIASSKKDIQWLSDDTNFRHDLYNTLFSEHIILPPLKNRIDDIPEFAQYFFKRYLIQKNSAKLNISADNFQILKQKTWVGNIEELETFIKKTVDDLYHSDEYSIQNLNKILKEKLDIPDYQSPSNKLNKHEYELCIEFEKKHGLFTRSKAMIPVLEDVKKYAQSSLNILILGETGTGKELIARAIHDISGREGEYRTINCASIPGETFEGDVFGYMKGSHSLAHQDHKGYFEQADGGTLFLDEVGELPSKQQAKLLRAIEYKEIQPLGSDNTIKVDVRIIFATNADLETMITNGEFRKDQYYRIADCVVKLPPLSDRKTDIPSLSVYLFEKALEDEDIPLSIKIKPEYFEPLIEKEWKGNIRDLRRYIKKLVIDFTSGNQTVERLKSLISGTDTETKRDNSIFENDKQQTLFIARIARELNWSELARESTVYNTTESCKKIIYTIIIRLLYHYKAVQNAAEYLVNEHIIDDKEIDIITKECQTLLEEISKNKNNSSWLKRYIYAPERKEMLPEILSNIE